MIKPATLAKATYGNRWRIVKRKIDVVRWLEHCPPYQPPIYQWMIEPPQDKNLPVKLYPTFEAARAAFAVGRDVWE